MIVRIKKYIALEMFDLSSVFDPDPIGAPAVFAKNFEPNSDDLADVTTTANHVEINAETSKKTSILYQLNHVGHSDKQINSQTQHSQNSWVILTYMRHITHFPRSKSS